MRANKLSLSHWCRTNVLWHLLNYWHPRERYRMGTKAFAIAHSLLPYCPHTPILNAWMRSFAVCSVFIRYMCTWAYRVCESNSLSLFGPISATMCRIVKWFGNLKKMEAEDRVVLKVCWNGRGRRWYGQKGGELPGGRSFDDGWKAVNPWFEAEGFCKIEGEMVFCPQVE